MLKLKGEEVINMIKRYLVIGSWVDKTTQSPKSNLAEISEGTNKNGHKFQIADTARTMVLEEAHDVGTVLSFSMEIQAENTATKAKIQ